MSDLINRPYLLNKKITSENSSLPKNNHDENKFTLFVPKSDGKISDTKNKPPSKTKRVVKASKNNLVVLKSKVSNSIPIISSLHNKPDKIIDYLKTGKYKKVLIRSYHGLGDNLILYAGGAIQKLRKMFPDIEISFHTKLGQEEIFGIVDNEASHYDIVFEIIMPCSEWEKKCWNKAEKSMELEFGFDVDYGKCDWTLPIKYQSALIGVHFYSTCLKSLCVSKDSAKILWDYIQDKNFIPIETHFHHPTSHAKLFEFENVNVGSQKAKVSKLFGLLSACAGFAGTASGNFHAALFVFPPEKILFLKTNFNADRITNLPVHQLDVRDPRHIDFSVVDKWLADVRGETSNKTWL